MNDDTDLTPLDRLGNDATHLLMGPALATAAVQTPGLWGQAFALLWLAWVVLALAKQVVDGWRRGGGRRGDAILDAALVAWGSGWVASEHPGAWVAVACAGLATVALRAWQQWRRK